jgi:tetratricopeptide (TPR) repeat protein
MPQELETRKEQVRKWFDVAYCKAKARWLLDHQGENLELLDWASHLADLAQVMEPAGLAARVLRARVLRRRGDIDQAIALLEEVRCGKPEKFASDEDEEAWFLSCRLLGDLYLNVKPDQAILCFQEYRKHGKSGADTVYKMGVAYENLGDYARARKCYEMVAAYEGHPLRPDANNALHRLQTTPQ